MEDSVVCKQDFDSEGTQSSIVESSSEEEKIEHFYDGNSPFKIPTSVLYIKTEDSVVKQEKKEYEVEYVESKFTIEPLKWEDQYQIKTECIDIKLEEHRDSEISPTDRTTIHQGSSNVQTFKCTYCSFESKYRWSRNRHLLTHETNSSLHKNSSDKYRSSLTKRRLIHGEASQVQMDNLKSHQLRHKNLSQPRMYKCDGCNYESRYKHSLKLHRLKHKDPSEVDMYKCDKCTYESRYKETWERHQLVHMDPSQVQMFKCDQCSFETKCSRYIKRHQLLHRNFTKEEMYRCDKCSYENRNKNNLRMHQMVHKHPSEVRMYKCDECGYQSKYKNSIKVHVLTHKHTQNK